VGMLEAQAGSPLPCPYVEDATSEDAQPTPSQPSGVFTTP
jgi:hypothetical protein